LRWSRSALDDLKQQLVHIAHDDPAAARSVAERIAAAVSLLAERAIGRPRRVAGTYEKLVRGLPYIIAYSIEATDGGETISILHTARNWPDGDWPA
jgi:plasmid stabilization system protein ParE